MRNFFKNIMLVICVLAVAGCATTRTKKIPDNAFSLKDLCDEYKVAYNLDPVSQNIFLSRGVATASTLVGSDIVLIDGQKIILSAPIKVERGIVIVPPDFRNKVLDSLVAKIDDVAKKDYTIRKVRTIVVDAGHGGKDPGAIGPSGIHEKTVVLDISNRLAALLKKRGFNVVMTRTTDEFIPLRDRTVIACKAKADLFVSVHANAHEKRSVNGVEVYSLKNLDNLELNETERLENHDILFKELSMKRGDADLKKIVSDMLYTYKQGESAALAGAMAHSTSSDLNAKNLGAKTSRFHVLRNTLVPAVLVEVGYLTNPKEESALKSKSYREKIAQSIAKSVEDYAQGK